MKKIFLEVESRLEIPDYEILQVSKKLPKNLVIVFSIQHKNLASKLKNTLEKNHKVLLFSQVLGCTTLQFPKEAEALILLSSGKFHAFNFFSEKFPNLPIYILRNNSLQLLDKKEFELYFKKQKTAYLNFLNSETIGILISLKPGQENFDKALKFKNSDLIKNKKSYLFLTNDLNTSEFENFPQIQSWVNTACRRLDLDLSSASNFGNKIINLERIK